MSKLLVGLLVASLLAAALAALFFTNPQPRPLPPVAYSQFAGALEAGQVESVRIAGAQITGRMKDATRFSTTAPSSPLAQALIDRMIERKVSVSAVETEPESAAVAFLVNWLPFLISYSLLFGGLWFVFTRPVLRLVIALEAIVRAGRKPE